MKIYEVRPLFCRFGLYAGDQIIAIFSEEEKAQQTAENLNNANVVGGELRPTTHAKWFPLTTKRGLFMCTNCCFGSPVKMNFCANCGAKMDWSN